MNYCKYFSNRKVGYFSSFRTSFFKFYPFRPKLQGEIIPKDNYAYTTYNIKILIMYQQRFTDLLKIFVIKAF